MSNPATATNGSMNPWTWLAKQTAPKDTARGAGPPRIAQPGDVVNEWTLLRYEPGVPNGRWKCRCACGAERYVRVKASGTSQNCGHSRTREKPTLYLKDMK